MMKSKTLERVMRALITLLGAGVGAGIAALLLPLLLGRWPEGFRTFYGPLALYGCLCLVFGVVFLLLSRAIIRWFMQMSAALERKWDSMPTQQIVLASLGLILGLVVAALVNQLILSAGASLVTLSFSAIIYVMLGTVGLQVGYRRYHTGKQEGRRLRRRLRKHNASVGAILDDALLLDDDEEDESAAAPDAGPCRKYLDTSALIDGRVVDVAKAGFLEGELIAPRFVLEELQHVADSSDGMRRTRGRRGLDMLQKLQQTRDVTIDETDYPDATEVDVKLLRLCGAKGGAIVTNDYNLNKVAGVTGLRVLNINDLANALKPVLSAGEELTVRVMREGKEPGQGVAYLDDGTMIVVENGRRFVGEDVNVVVSTVLQTSAGRMIFTRVKAGEEQAE